MFAQLTSRTNALRLFVAAAAVMILAYLGIFFVPTESGNTGIYVLPAMPSLVWIYIIACAVLIVSIIMFAIRSRNRIGIGALVVGAFLLLLPLIKVVSAPQLLHKHVTSLSVGDHVYQLAQNMFPSCPDTFDAQTYTCYSRTFLYQCDSLGLLCSIKSKELLVKQETPIHLQLEGAEIEVIADQNDVVYKMPA